MSRVVCISLLMWNAPWFILLPAMFTFAILGVMWNAYYGQPLLLDWQNFADCFYITSWLFGCCVTSYRCVLSIWQGPVVDVSQHMAVFIYESVFWLHAAGIIWYSVKSKSQLFLLWNVLGKALTFQLLCVFLSTTEQVPTHALVFVRVVMPSFALLTLFSNAVQHSCGEYVKQERQRNLLSLESLGRISTMLLQ